jgi:hypothetical protein
MGTRSKRAQRHDGEKSPDGRKTLQHGYPVPRIESGSEHGQENGPASEAVGNEVDVTASASRVPAV